jgi:hypothetical protein
MTPEEYEIEADFQFLELVDIRIAQLLQAVHASAGNEDARAALNALIARRAATQKKYQQKESD